MTLKRILPLAILAGLIVAAFAFDLPGYLSLDGLSAHYHQLQAWEHDHPYSAPLVFGAIYALAVALSLPGGAILTIIGGFLFGVVLGTTIVVVSATIGATAVFLIAKTSFGDALRERAGNWIKSMEEGLNDDAFSYMLVLRLVPLFPFWLVNIAPAFLGVKLRTYVLSTFVGIIPGSAVYTSVGNGVGAILDAGGSPDLSVIFSPAILGPLIGLALLALIPVWWKRRRRAQAKVTTDKGSERLRTVTDGNSR